MSESKAPRAARGRPPKQIAGQFAVREALVRTGVEILTEKGFAAVGIDEVLRRVGVPKGSFYHYFASKEAFGTEVIAAYAAYFARKLDRWLLAADRAPLDRIRDFVADVRAGMLRHDCRRGCLIGNLGQEIGALPEGYRAQLGDVFADWQARLARCLREAQAQGELSADADAGQLAAFFWIGWEGAVLRAKLERSAAPLDIFATGFFAGLAR